MTNDLIERLRQLAGNTGKMTWVGDLPMPATAVLHLSADRIEALTAEVERLREALELADAALRGANMNMNVVERKVRAALAGDSHE